MQSSQQISFLIHDLAHWLDYYILECKLLSGSLAQSANTRSQNWPPWMYRDTQPSIWKVWAAVL